MTTAHGHRQRGQKLTLDANRATLIRNARFRVSSNLCARQPSRPIDASRVEAHEMENMPAEMRGIDQVRGKTEWWEKNMEVHSAKVTGPFVARDTFVVQFDIDVTEKASKKRMQMSEVGIYTVKDGKVAREEFLPLAQKKE